MQQQLHTSNTWPTTTTRRTASTIRESEKKDSSGRKEILFFKAHHPNPNANPNEGKDGEMGS
jgi:hypothetical protein